jgi:DNA-binding MarR family transcriptional regulator
MRRSEAAALLIELYPKVFSACHDRHVGSGPKKLRLTTQQEMILGHLDEGYGMSVNRLAEHMGVTPSTMSLAIDRLESKGLVRRRRDSRDRRSVKVTLTKEGLKVRSAQDVLSPLRVEALLSELGSEELEHSLYGLWLLGQAAQRLIDKRGAGDPAFAAPRWEGRK